MRRAGVRVALGESLRRERSEQELLALAVERLRRSMILSDSNAAYAGYASAEPASELQEWKATPADGLEDE